MFPRMCSVLLLLLSACATTQPSPDLQEAENLRLANLQRAAALPWTDEGRCVVRESSNEWRVLADELRREARLARECGYDFVIGVRSARHKAVLLEEAPFLNVVIMDWC